MFNKNAQECVQRALAHQISDPVHDPAARRFIVNECSQAFNSIAAWPSYNTINNLERERVACLKPLQLAVARKVGLQIPETIITNDPISARSFCEKEISVIFKTLSAPISTFGETRRVKSDHMDKLPSVSHAPVIFQHEVVKQKDIRVTVVGSEVFAACIERNNPFAENYPDWRLDASAECKVFELPAELADRVRLLMSTLGLVYGVIDFIQSERGEFIFLEVNPSGQFLFVEADTGLPISRQIGKALLGI